MWIAYLILHKKTTLYYRLIAIVVLLSNTSASKIYLNLYILHFKDTNMARHVIRLFPLPSKYNKSAVFD